MTNHFVRVQKLMTHSLCSNNPPPLLCLYLLASPLQISVFSPLNNNEMTRDLSSTKLKCVFTNELYRLKFEHETKSQIVNKSTLKQDSSYIINITLCYWKVCFHSFYQFKSAACPPPPQLLFANHNNLPFRHCLF